MDRISLSQIFSQGLRGILNGQVAVSKTQAQLSSGLRVTVPSDDPAAAAQILQLDQTQANIDQYKKNITGATNNLTLEDSSLADVSTVLTRVRELAVNAGSGVLTASDRQALAAELSSRLDELAGIANSRNSNGEYIFAGFQGQQAPFIQSATGYSYQGDAGQRSVQVSSSTYVPVNDSGKDIFVNVASTRLPGTATSTNTGNATIAMGQIADPTQFSASFHGPYTVTINTTGPTPTYQVDTVPAGAAVATGNYVSGEAITFNGAKIDIVGTPGNGDTFTVTAPSTQDTFTTLTKLAKGLTSLSDSPDDKQRLTDLVSETLDNLDSAETNINTVRAKVGARLNILQSTSDLQDGVGLINKQVLSQVRDLDYASAISQLTQQNVVLQAAQQSFAKISSLTLFDFIR
ncbi:MAG: flgL [Verrucomicrobiaceae bacterium]|nr:flgL [Verrucomicrobiaceae bacterium]